jgi:hypothetical protein
MVWSVPRKSPLPPHPKVTRILRRRIDVLPGKKLKTIVKSFERAMREAAGVAHVSSAEMSFVENFIYKNSGLSMHQVTTGVEEAVKKGARTLTDALKGMDTGQGKPKEEREPIAAQAQWDGRTAAQYKEFLQIIEEWEGTTPNTPRTPTHRLKLKAIFDSDGPEKAAHVAIYWITKHIDFIAQDPDKNFDLAIILNQYETSKAEMEVSGWTVDQQRELDRKEAEID